MHKHPDKVTMRISTSSVVTAALALMALYTLFLLRDLVLVVLTAVVIASAIEPATRWFGRYRIPRLPSVILIYLVAGAFLAGLFYSVVPQLLGEASGFLNQLPEYVSALPALDNVDAVQNFDAAGTGQVLSNLGGGISLDSLVGNFSGYLTRIPGGVFSTVSAIFGGVFSFVLIIVISFYLAVQKDGIENFLRIVTPYKHQAYAINLWERAQKRIGLWMQGQILLVVLIGVLVYLGLTVLGVKNALLFAILAGFFELIPLFGPILASIPAIFTGFIDGGASLALVIAAVYIVIQQFENHLIYPLVVHKVVGVPALLVILALIVGGQLAGFLGIILAVPIATALMEFTNDIQKHNKKLAEKASHHS